MGAQDPGVTPSQELYSFSAARDVIASGSPWPENYVQLPEYRVPPLSGEIVGGECTPDVCVWKLLHVSASVFGAQDRPSQNMLQDFPGGPGVKNPPSSAGDVGSIPGRETKIPHAAGQLNPQASTTEKPVQLRPDAAKNKCFLKRKKWPTEDTLTPLSFSLKAGNKSLL